MSQIKQFCVVNISESFPITPLEPAFQPFSGGKSVLPKLNKRNCNTLWEILKGVYMCVYLYKSISFIFVTRGDYCLGRKMQSWHKISLIHRLVFVSWNIWAFCQTTCQYVHLFLGYPQFLLVHSFWLKYVAGVVFFSSSRNKLYFQLQL